MAERDLLADLTDAQREAVTHIEGPLLILAAAGSGKTRVITRRVAYLLQQGVRAGNILAITFTNKAAGEMRQRVEDLVPGNRVWISTFHSLGARLLRQYADRLGLDRNFTIYDQADRSKLLKMALEDAGLDNNRFTPDTIGAAISKAKNQLLSPERTPNAPTTFTPDRGPRLPDLREAAARRQRPGLRRPALLAGPRPEERRRAARRTRRPLPLRPHRRVPGHQPGPVRHRPRPVHGLPQPVRRGRPGPIDLQIPRLGHPQYPRFRARLPRRPRADAGDELPQHEGDPPRRRRPDRPQQAAQAQRPRHRKPGRPAGHGADLRDRRGRGRGHRPAHPRGGGTGKRAYRDFAVFLRINALSRGLETAFVKQRVPFQIVKGLAFFDRKENRDVLAYLRLLLNPRDDLSFLRAVNEPARGIGKVSLEHLRAYAEPREMSLLAAVREVAKIPALKGKAAAGLRDFAG